MKLNFLLILLFNLLLINCFSQRLIYEDNIRGGILWDGIINYGTPLVRKLNMQPPNGSTVEKIFALVLVQRSYYTDTGYCKINGEKIFFKDKNKITGFTLNVNNYDSLHNIYYYDLTNQIPPDSLANLSIEYIFNSGTNVDFNATRGIALGVIFKNNLYPPNLLAVYVPTIEVSNTEIHKFKLANPINNNIPVLMSTNVFISCPITLGYGGHLILQNDTLGLIGESDPIVAQDVVQGGTMGSFDFYNQTGAGRSGDVFNNSVQDDDAILNLQNKPYVKQPELQLKIRSRVFNGGTGHLPLSFLFAYTTYCEEFTVSTPEPQTVCKNEPLQLTVTGGNRYEWQPQVGLSCYDCPNPVVFTDTSRFWTVRVWNNDTCSVVRPVQVGVYEFPKFGGATITPTTCADSTGKIVVTKHPSVLGAPLWSIDGGAFMGGSGVAKTYTNLPEGSYTITIKDGNDCTADTTLTITYTIPTTANFTLNPTQGVAPLQVEVSNLSSNYTHSVWYLQNTFKDSTLTQLYLDTSGLYTLQLITWYKDPKCADTFLRTILVYDTLVISVPNVFSPNGDGINDAYGITVNQPCTISYILLNRWGATLTTDEITTTTDGFIPFWDGNESEEGVYFYKIKVSVQNSLAKQEVKEVSGFFHLRK